MKGDPANIRDKNKEMAFGEQTATIGDVIEKESHRDGASTSSYLNSTVKVKAKRQ